MQIDNYYKEVLITKNGQNIMAIFKRDVKRIFLTLKITTFHISSWVFFRKICVLSTSMFLFGDRYFYVG